MSTSVRYVRHSSALAALWAAAMLVVSASPSARQGAVTQAPPPGARFRTGVDVVNVTVTVTDRQGRFVPNLRREDFVVYEDGRLQSVTHFANERVPVSLGLALDASGSMVGAKMDSAREALRRFVEDLLGPDDEVFVYRFSETAELVQGWTHDRAAVTRQIATVRPNGGTALYDTVAESVAMAQAGQHRKRALVVISDGNDMHSTLKVEDVRQRIREAEVLVYAVGIDGEEGPRTVGQPQRPRPTSPPPIGIPGPGPFTGGRRFPRPVQPVPPVPWPSAGISRPRDDRVNDLALRAMTDDSGGRTEIIRSSADLDPATAAIANELSQQYFLAYSVAGAKEGRWRNIRVEVRNPYLTVRARRGYLY